MSAIVKTQETVAQMAALTARIRSLDSVEDVTEVRARVEAIKGWAKIHKQTKKLRLDLLRLEVHALVRIVELGGADTLKSERTAAEWLADLSPEDRENYIRESGEGVTTAVGMVRTIQRIERLEQEVSEYRAAGTAFATEPMSDRRADHLQMMARKDRVIGISAALAAAVEDYAPADEPFTITEMADRIIEDAAIEERHAADAAFRDAVKEVCRKALRSAPPVLLRDVPIPAFITVRNEEDVYVRVPTVNAQVDHVTETIRMREELVQQDLAAIEQLKRFEDALRSLPGASGESRIGPLLAGSVLEDAA